MASWLPLTDYATKYKVSISTLRRRIKNDKINFQFDDGKYYILDSPPEQHGTETPVIAALGAITTAAAPVQVPMSAVEHASDLALTTQRIVDELKKAYALILQEKEEQVLQLKGEIADLKTLARVLETENNRLMEALEKEKGKSKDLPVTFY